MSDPILSRERTDAKCPPECHGDGYLHPLDERETRCPIRTCDCGHKGSEHVAGYCQFCKCDEPEYENVHCDHWYDGEACCRCGDPGLTPCPACGEAEG